MVFIYIRVINILLTNKSKTECRNTIRLLQITDCHLFCETDKILLGVNTHDSLKAVINEIDALNVAFDYFVVTGDISQDQSIESYQYFCSAVAHWSKPSIWLPGNHDHLANMQEVMQLAGAPFYQQVLLNEHWQMIILDSQVEKKPHGYLNDDQFDLLEKALEVHPDKFAIILLHHDPFHTNSEWLDQHRLHNQDVFWQKLVNFSQVKVVLCGHIHQDMDFEYQNCRVLSSPSTCVQFLPNSDEFALDTATPGWREITLHEDGRVETQAMRINDSSFNPDMKSTGY